VVKLLRPQASRRWDWTSYGCDRQKKGRPGDLRDTMIAAIALAYHAERVTCNTSPFEDVSISIVNPCARWMHLDLRRRAEAK
jgi:predicted nucleic acid-binding protein